MFRWPLRVYYEDTDFGGVVYYANYLRFFERARTEWLRSLGLEHPRLAREDGLQFVVRRAEIDFKRGARLDDELTITVELAERKRTYVTLRQQALRGEEPMAIAIVQAACIHRDTLKPAALPAALAARLAA
ncbi:MAG: tol-pal system-associated acyl-CoA thioesterase [Burkholderiales bacterium]